MKLMTPLRRTPLQPYPSSDIKDYLIYMDELITMRAAAEEQGRPLEELQGFDRCMRVAQDMTTFMIQRNIAVASQDKEKNGD